MKPQARSPRGGAALGAGVLVLIALVAVVAIRLWRPALGTTVRGAATTPGSAPSEEARLREAAARAPRDGVARQELGRFLLDNGRPFEAIWELRAAQALNPTDSAITLQLAVALASASFYDAAIDQLEPLVARTAPTREGRVQLATLYVARGEPGRAVSLLLATPDIANWAEGQLALGKARQAADETGDAIAAYRRAVALAPAAEEPRLRLAGLLLREKQVADARRVLQSAPPDALPSPRRLTLLAETVLDADGASAARWLAAALEADPAHVPALVALAGLHRREGRLKEAVRAYGDALRQAPGDAQANEAAAEMLQETGRRAESHALRARAFRSRGLPGRAIREYEALAKFPSHYRDAILEQSLLLVQTQQKPRAAAIVETALSRYPLDTALYERLVVLLLIVRKHEAARRRCAEWQRLDPKSRRPAWLLSQIAADEGKIDEARRLLEPVVAAEPENTDFAATLADILLKETRPPLAQVRSLLERALANPATEPKTHLQLAEVLQHPPCPTRQQSPAVARRT